MKTHLTVVLLLSIQILYAQDDDRNVGLFNITQFSFISVSEISGAAFYSESNARAFSLNTIFGYFAIPGKFSAGLGFGLDGYHDPGFNTAPLYADLRYYLKNSANSPYALLDWGVLLPLSQIFSRGYGGRVGAGYKFRATRKILLNMDISFVNKSVEDNIDFRGMGFTVGIVF